MSMNKTCAISSWMSFELRWTLSGVTPTRIEPNYSALRSGIRMKGRASCRRVLKCLMTSWPDHLSSGIKNDINAQLWACRNQMSTARNPAGVSPVQWRSTMNRLVLAFIILAVLLFVPAGRITWTRGWLFLLVFILLKAASIAYFTHAHPALLAVRSLVPPDSKRWDKIVICLLFVAMLAIPPVAGLDDGRFHWSSISCWVVALGYVVQLAGWIGVAWAETVNRFFEPGV